MLQCWGTTRQGLNKIKWSEKQLLPNNLICGNVSGTDSQCNNSNSLRLIIYCIKIFICTLNIVFDVNWGKSYWNLMGIDIELNLIKLHLITYYDRIELNIRKILQTGAECPDCLLVEIGRRQQKFNWNKTLTKLNQITLK